MGFRGRPPFACEEPTRAAVHVEREGDSYCPFPNPGLKNIPLFFDEEAVEHSKVLQMAERAGTPKGLYLFVQGAQRP